MYNTKLQIKTFFVFTIFQKKNIKIREYTYVHAHEYTSSCFNEHRRGTKEREKQNKREEKTWKKEERRKREGREEDATTQFTMARHGAIYSPEAATFFRISTSGTVHDRSKHTHSHTHTLAKRFSRESFRSLSWKLQRHRPDERRITGERSGDRSADSSGEC